MTASIFGAAFDRLDADLRSSILNSLRTRRANYINGLRGTRWSQVRFILVGDRPGNGAKQLPASHHHTPFYSTKNSSLWLNKGLVETGIHENDLFWLNSADLHGTPTNPCHLQGWTSNPQVIALGNNASTWLTSHGVEHSKVAHPQAWKRFHSREPYPLFDMLREWVELDLQDVGP